MSVYVDDMEAPFGRYVMCHMIADTDEELHAMADRIGVARRWHQKPPKASSSHYDIAKTMRAKAVAAGAVEITWRECSMMTFDRRRDPAAPLRKLADVRAAFATAEARWRAPAQEKLL